MVAKRHRPSMVLRSPADLLRRLCHIQGAREIQESQGARDTPEQDGGRQTSQRRPNQVAGKESHLGFYRPDRGRELPLTAPLAQRNKFLQPAILLFLPIYLLL